MHIQTYLFFDGRCEEAIDFYRQTLDAKVEMLMRYKDNPDGCPEGMVPPGSENKVMHAAIKIGETMVLASDGRCTGTPNFQGFSLSVNASDDSEAKRLFDALGVGGQVHMPLGKTFFASSFGMVADKFGITWMVLVPTM